MNICELFIRRPVMTTLLMVGLLIFGFFGYHFLPVNDLPNVDYPTIVVSAKLPGASPETMATSVATPLEEQFSTIAGIDSMSSSSSLGSTKISLQFNLGRNIDAAAGDVQSAISAALRQLPSDMPSAPTSRKVNSSDSPILYIALSSTTLPLATVDQYAENLLAQRISMIDGVAQVNVYGSQKYAVRIQVDPDQLAARNIDIAEVKQAVQHANVNLPSGSLYGAKQTFLVQAAGQLTNATEYRQMVVAYHNGQPIKLMELGRVIDSIENTKTASSYNGTPAIVLAIQRQPGSNTIAVVDNIKKLLPTFAKQLPTGINLQTISDRSESIRAAIKDVQWTLLIAILLVIVVIFAFLRTVAATIIPSITLPLALIGTFAVMNLCGFSINNLTLLSLTLAVGFVVDDAIVMLENIVRHREQGQSTLAAALAGSKEISFTIISMTLSLAVVFIPILFMSGIIGRLFHEFAISICATIILSGIISLTLTPMLCNKLLTKSTINTESRWYKKSEHVFARLLHCYETGLDWILKNRRITLYAFIASLIIVALLFAFIPKGFLPTEDTGQLTGFTETDSAMPFSDALVKQEQIAQIIRKNPNVQGVMSSVGAGGASSDGNSGRILVRLKSRNSRHLDADALVQQLRPQLLRIPGLRVYLQNVPSINIGSRISKSTYQYTLQDSNNDELKFWANNFYQNFKQIPELQDVATDLQFTGPQIQLSIDRERAAALDVTAEQIENTLANAFGASQISSIYAATDTYEVIMELLPEKQADPSAIANLYVKSNNGKLVPLSAVADITLGSGPASINHQTQIPAVTISFNLSPSTSLSNAVAAIDKVKTKLHPPATLISGFKGTAQTFQDSVKGLGLLLILTIIVIYILLGILYESFIHPLTILSGLPSAGVGALLTLLICRTDLNLYSFIGIIMLTGIVKKNAIMMIDFAIAAQRQENKSPLEAIRQACLIRFRPIMMTTMAALMGALPIALALGAGAETRRPLGLAVVGGLLVSQVLTLFITPVIYLYFEKLRRKFVL